MRLWKRRYLCMALASLPASSPAYAKPTQASVTRIADLERRYSQSFVTGDATVAQRLLAKDFIGFGPNGKSWDKAAMLATVRTLPHQASARITSLVIRVHGATVIASGTEDDIDAGSTTVSHRRWLDTWQRFRSGWRMIASAEIEPKRQ